MIKEMFVSSTPHETKVAVTEDDQLAEVFFERENEYTLAGSIYKGRVTRVLPGMQSAFVDIGLERDAFLYVSDFLDLGNLEEDEELDEVAIRPETYVTNRPEPEPRKFEGFKPAQGEADEFVDEAAEAEIEGDDDQEDEDVAADPAGLNVQERQFRGARRRRRGRRGRAFPESRFSRETETHTHEHRPTADVEPVEQSFEQVILPGESISKYRGTRPHGGAYEQEQVPEEPLNELMSELTTAPPEHEHEPLPIIEDQLPPPSSQPRQSSAPVVLPGESLRKYRRAEPKPEEPEVSEPKVAPPPLARSPYVEHVVPATRSVSLDEEHSRDARDSVSPFLLPGESIRKYQKRDHSQPDSPVSESHPPIASDAQALATDAVQPIEERPQPGTDVIETQTAAGNAQEPLEPEQSGVSDRDTENAVTERTSETPASEESDAESAEASVRIDTRSQVAPFVLPGESIRKYTRRRGGKAGASAKAEAAVSPQTEVEPEPATNDTRAADESQKNRDVTDVETAGASASVENAAVDTDATSAQIPSSTSETDLPVDEPPASDAERFEDMNVAAVFGGDAASTADTPGETSLSVADEIREASDEPHRTAPETVEDTAAQADEAAAELAETRPHIPADEHVMPERRGFEPTPAGTVEHEEIDSEDVSEVEHDFSGVHSDVEDDVIFEELEETTLAPQAAEALNDERAPEPFVIEGGYEPEENGAGAEAAVEDDFEGDEADEEAEQDSEEPSVATAGSMPYPQRRFDRDRRRGRRGGRRPQGGGRPPRRDMQRQNIQIADLLKEGQEVLIQIAKEPIGKKGARITSHIALPGRFLVYMPTVNHIGVSRKINSEEERQRLKRIMISEREGGHGGFIVRTAAAGITEEELRADIRFLKNLWQEIRTRSDNSKAPALIYHDLNLVERVLRDQVTSDFSVIWVDSEQEYERILRFANRFQPALVRKVKLYTKDTPLFEQFGIQEEINKALKSKVWLKSGGYIVINQTEALVAIDINTGKYVGKTTRLEDTIVKTNIDAIKEIVRQIRLRDLGGIIVIDFIDMDERKNRQKVMQALEEALKADRAPSKVLQFNDFGLVAITRKRVKQSLERTLGQPCPYCAGNGFVKSITTVCNDIYVEARKLCRHFDKDAVLLRVNPEVAKALKANNGRMVSEIEEMARRTVIVKPDPQLHTEQFDFN